MPTAIALLPIDKVFRFDPVLIEQIGVSSIFNPESAAVPDCSGSTYFASSDPETITGLNSNTVSVQGSTAFEIRLDRETKITFYAVMRSTKSLQQAFRQINIEIQGCSTEALTVNYASNGYVFKYIQQNDPLSSHSTIMTAQQLRGLLSNPVLPICEPSEWFIS